MIQCTYCTRYLLTAVHSLLKFNVQCTAHCAVDNLRSGEPQSTGVSCVVMQARYFVPFTVYKCTRVHVSYLKYLLLYESTCTWSYSTVSVLCYQNSHVAKFLNQLPLMSKMSSVSPFAKGFPILSAMPLLSKGHSSTKQKA